MHRQSRCGMSHFVPHRFVTGVAAARSWRQLHGRSKLTGHYKHQETDEMNLSILPSSSSTLLFLHHSPSFITTCLYQFRFFDCCSPRCFASACPTLPFPRHRNVVNLCHTISAFATRLAYMPEPSKRSAKMANKWYIWGCCVVVGQKSAQSPFRATPTHFA